MDVICYGCGRGENPENTLMAIQHCQQVNPNWGIEMDVQMTKDGEVVLFHDANTKTITGVDRMIRETDLKQLQLLNAGYNYEVNGTFPYRENPLEIPTLKKVCQAFPTAILVLDIHSKNPLVVDKTIEILETYGKGNQITIVSHYDAIVKEFKRRRPNWSYGAAISEGAKMVFSSLVFLDFLFPLESNVLMLPAKLGRLKVLGKRVVAHALKRNKKIWAWAELWIFPGLGKKAVMVDSLNAMNALRKQKVDGVFTDYPHKLNREITVSH